MSGTKKDEGALDPSSSQPPFQMMEQSLRIRELLPPASRRRGMISPHPPPEEEEAPPLPPPPFLQEILPGKSITRQDSHFVCTPPPPASSSISSCLSSKNRRTSSSSSSHSATITTISSMTAAIGLVSSSKPRTKSLLSSFLSKLFDEKGVNNPKENVILIPDNFFNDHVSKSQHGSSSQSTFYGTQQNLSEKMRIVQEESTGTKNLSSNKDRDDAKGGEDKGGFFCAEDDSLEEEQQQQDGGCQYHYEQQEQHDSEAATAAWQDSCRSLEPLAKDGSEIILLDSNSNNGKSPTSIMDLFESEGIPEHLQKRD